MMVNDTIENDNILTRKFRIIIIFFVCYMINLGIILMQKFMLEMFQRIKFLMKNYWIFLNHLAKFQV